MKVIPYWRKWGAPHLPNSNCKQNGHCLRSQVISHQVKGMVCKKASQIQCFLNTGYFVAFCYSPFSRKVAYSEIKLMQYVNTGFPAMIFRSSAWKNSQRSRFSSFSGSYECEDLSWKTQGNSCWKRLWLVWLKVASAHEKFSHSVCPRPSQK